MSTILRIEGVENARLPAHALHLAIGIFDGVHLGHRAVIEAAVQTAHRDGASSAVLTFEPHPSVVLRPEQPTRLLMSRGAKARVLADLGVDAIVTEPFTKEFAELAAEAFLPWLKQRLPRLAGVYVGENFRFGQGRRGDLALLVAEGKKHGLTVFSAPRVSLDGEPISSSRIRAALETGDIAAANAMLGYTYFSEGPVIPGNRLGRTMGFPTLNLSWSPDLQPRFGVYVVRVTGARSAAPLRAVANYGARPTIERDAEPRLEVHVLDDCPYDAGDVITVEWLKFIRPEMKFGGLGTLRAQIATDRAAAQEYFERER